MEIINVATYVLRPHPRHEEFFDNITGQQWEWFKRSIAEHGVLQAIVISNDLTILNGHQRWRACKELGIASLPVIIRENMDDPDDQLRIMLGSNITR